MAPPTMFSVAGGQYMASGKAKRHEDVTPGIRQQIIEYCRRAMADGTYPARRFYPDLLTSDSSVDARFVAGTG